MTTTSAPTLTLCRITLSQAQHLGMSAHAAGGWIATAPVCRYAAETVLGDRALVALLPADWSEASLPLTIAERVDLAARLESASGYSDDRTTAADFAARIRAQMAVRS
jgi:hypothetical protein